MRTYTGQIIKQVLPAYMRNFDCIINLHSPQVFNCLFLLFPLDRELSTSWIHWDNPSPGRAVSILGDHAQTKRRAICIALSFRCNGTLVSLTIPSQVRGSDYSRVDDTLELHPSIWRFIAGYKFISENDQRQRVLGATDNIYVSDVDVLSFNFNVMLQMDIQAGDVLGFRLMELYKLWR